MAKLRRAKYRPQLDVDMPRDFWNYPFNPITGWYVGGEHTNSKSRTKYNQLIRDERDKRLSNKG